MPRSGCRRAMTEVATAAQPDTILAWYRRLVARKFDGSQARRGTGRPRIDQDVEGLIVRMARENRSWGYDRIVGAIANLGYHVSDQTVGNVLRRRGIPPAPERKPTTTWAEFIRPHLALLAATDFFTVEVLTLRGLVTSNGQKIDTLGSGVRPILECQIASHDRPAFRGEVREPFVEIGADFARMSACAFDLDC